jgi:hypothetical protein
MGFKKGAACAPKGRENYHIEELSTRTPAESGFMLERLCRAPIMKAIDARISGLH